MGKLNSWNFLWLKLSQIHKLSKTQLGIILIWTFYLYQKKESVETWDVLKLLTIHKEFNGACKVGQSWDNKYVGFYVYKKQ